MLTITSRGCIFLSPLHLGVVTLPHKCMSSTNDDYGPHTYTLFRDDAVTPDANDKNEINMDRLSLFLSFYLRGSIRGDMRVLLEAPRYIRTSSGLSQSRIVAAFVALLHCRGTTVFLYRIDLTNSSNERS